LSKRLIYYVSGNGHDVIFCQVTILVFIKQQKPLYNTKRNQNSNKPTDHFQFPFASVSKPVLARNMSLIQMKMNVQGKTHFHINSFVQRLVLTQSQTKARKLRTLRGEKLNYKSVAKEISKPAFFWLLKSSGH